MLFWMPCFRFFVENGRQNASQRISTPPPGHPKNSPKNASATEPWIFIDLGSIWGAILVIFSWFRHQFRHNFLTFLHKVAISFCFDSFSYFFMNLTSSKVDKTGRQLDQCSRQQLQLDTGNKIHKRSRQRGHTYSASILLYNETNVPSLICPF